MAGTVSIELRERLLRSYFQRSLVADDTLYAALTDTVALANSAGDVIDEPAAGAYARTPIPLDPSHWELTGFGEIRNVQNVAFPAPAAGEDWGYIGGWALLDSPTAGITLAVGALVMPTAFTSDLPPLALGPGAITLALLD